MDCKYYYSFILMLSLLLIGFFIAVFCPLLTRIFGKWTSILLTLYPLSIFIFTASNLNYLKSNNLIEQSSWIPNLNIDLTFNLDGLSALFVLIISGFGILILLYSEGYFKNHSQKGRFYAYLIFFMTSMVGLPLSGNIILLFLFWELTSLSSFLLISFNHEKYNSRKYAVQAFLITSGGALTMLAGLILLGIHYNTYDIHEIILQADSKLPFISKSATAILLLIGAFCKSAQFPFHFWLPNAMEAPTPVSAYLHSATMVKAGIYLVARFNPLFQNELIWKNILIIAGSITMIVGALVALTQSDLKKILAFTTVSALGIIILLFGIGTPGAIQAAIIFLIAHAFYKGTLFLVTGNIDHNTGTRELHSLSGLKEKMPYTFLAALLACLSMSGIIPFIGFIGKELLYESVLNAEPFNFIIMALVFLSSAIFTGIAMKIGYGVFFGKTNIELTNVKEGSIYLLVGPIVFSILGLALGLLPAIIIEPVLNIAAAKSFKNIEAIELSIWHGFNLTLLLSALTLGAGIIIYLYRLKIDRLLHRSVSFLESSPNIVYDNGIKFILIASYRITRVFQNGYLRAYLITISLVFSILTMLVIFNSPEKILSNFSIPEIHNLNLYEWIIILFIITGLIKVLGTHSRVTALASMGVAGYGLALIFIIYSAPDAAMTQFLIETLTVVLFVLVLHKLPLFERSRDKKRSIAHLLISFTFGGLMCWTLLSVTSLPMNSEIKNFIGNNSLELAKGKNLVNIILVDYRAFDTMGESVVLGIAALGIYLLLRIEAKESEGKI